MIKSREAPWELICGCSSSREQGEVKGTLGFKLVKSIENQAHMGLIFRVPFSTFNGVKEAAHSVCRCVICGLCIYNESP